MAKKTITLDMLRSSLEKRKPDNESLPFFQAAAILFQFDRSELQALTQLLFRYDLSEPDFEYLRQYCSEGDQPGTFILQDFERVKIFRELNNRNTLRGLVHKMNFESDEPFQRLLVEYLGGKARSLSEMSIDELAIAQKITGWLRGILKDVPEEREISARIKREELLEPFRLITRNFQGREEELGFIKNYVNQKPDSENQQKKPLLISGIGGIGKSTVIAKFILDHYAAKGSNIVPFIYLDFDKPGLSISEPLELAYEGLRQLAAQYPGAELASIFLDIRQDIQYYVQKNRADRRTQQSGTSVATRGVFYGSVSRQYLSQYQKDLYAYKDPLLVVLDSFEEAQFRASASDLTKLFDFFKEIAQFVPGMNLIIVGRDDLVETDFAFTRYRIGEFDRKAADGFLLSRGVKDPYLRDQLVRQFGGNPLSLKLAANHILKLAEEHPGKPLKDLGAIFEGIDKERIQEQLVRRNLIHVKGALAKKVAFPGLLVRKISPQILQKVLAAPCGLGQIDDLQAQSIFNSLAEQDFLITREKGSLFFRKDLRVALYDLIVKEYGENAWKIHDLAVEFYTGKKAPEDRAEYLYHRLKRGDNPEICTELYTQDMRPFIENALTELPLNAYIRLATLMGFTVSDEATVNARLPEWEDYMIAQIKDILKDGDESGLHRKKKKLLARKERTYKSELYYYEALLYLRLAEFRAADEILEKARADKGDQPAWQLLKALITEYKLDFSAAFERFSSITFRTDRADDRLPIYMEWSVALARNAARLGVPFDKIERLLVSNFLPVYTGIDGKLLNDALPPAYKRAKSGWMPSDRWGPNDFIDVFQMIWKKSLTGNDFSGLYKQLLALQEEKISLEQKLLNKYQIAIQDISKPGAFNINAADALHYLEQLYLGDPEKIALEFLGLEKPTNKKGSFFERFFKKRKPDSFKKQAMDLIAEGEIEPAMELLRSNMKDDRLKNDLILISGRLKDLEKQMIRGTISDKDFKIQRMRINENLLHLINEMK